VILTKTICRGRGGKVTLDAISVVMLKLWIILCSLVLWPRLFGVSLLCVLSKMIDLATMSSSDRGYQKHCLG
jgi:hypothetical protein